MCALTLYNKIKYKCPHQFIHIEKKTFFTRQYIIIFTRKKVLKNKNMTTFLKILKYIIIIHYTFFIFQSACINVIILNSFKNINHIIQLKKHPMNVMSFMSTYIK